MTKIRLRARGTDGRLSIHTGGDDAPFSNPLGNLRRVLFHSELDYPAIVATRTGSTSFAAVAANKRRNEVKRLFAHNRPGIPLVFGVITNLGPDPVTFAGSVPVPLDIYGFGRWLTLGANANDVIIHEQAVAHAKAKLGAVTIAWKVFVMDTNLL